MFEAGKYYDAYFTLLEGTLHFQLGQGLDDVSTLHCGARIGVANFLRGTPHSCTLVAGPERVKIREISRERINDLSEHNPGTVAQLYEFMAYVLADHVALAWSGMIGGAPLLLPLVFLWQAELAPGLSVFESLPPAVLDQFRLQPRMSAPLLLSVADGTVAGRPR